MDLSMKKFTLITRKNKLSNDIQLRFLKRLSRLLLNGYPLIEALIIIKWDKQMIETADKMIHYLKSGKTIDQAFEYAHFHNSITSYLYFAKANGDLQTSMEKCVEMYAHRLKHINKFQQILRYPLILLCIFTVLLYFIKQSVLPSFANLFQSSQEAATTISMSIIVIDVVSTIVIICIILTILITFFWKVNKKKLDIKKQITIYQSIPVLRKYLKLQTSFLFATHLSNLLKTGMPIKDILANLADQNKLPIIAYYSELMITELKKGIHITNLFPHLLLFENQLAIIFQKNTDTEALEKDLIAYAEILTEELERKIMKTITFIQPVFFIILACFIVFIYVSLMWPMFQLIQTI